MGADLYITSITDPATERNRPKFHKAVAKRERLIADKKRYEQVIATWEKNGAYVFPSSSKRVEKLKARLEALKSRIEAAQREVTKYYNRMYPSSGYFRDSYNGSSVLWRLGMSWWQDVPDGVLTASQLEELVRKVQVAKLKPITAAELEEGVAKWMTKKILLRSGISTSATRSGGWFGFSSVLLLMRLLGTKFISACE